MGRTPRLCWAGLKWGQHCPRGSAGHWSVLDDPLGQCLPLNIMSQLIHLTMLPLLQRAKWVYPFASRKHDGCYCRTLQLESEQINLLAISCRAATTLGISGILSDFSLIYHLCLLILFPIQQITSWALFSNKLFCLSAIFSNKNVFTLWFQPSAFFSSEPETWSLCTICYYWFIQLKSFECFGIVN